MVSTARSIVVLVSFLSVSANAPAASPGAVSGGVPVVRNWQAPPFWSPAEAPRGGGDRSHTLGVENATPGAFPFIPISPCRQYDSRTASPLPDNTNRMITLSGAPCGISSSAAAVSVNITVFNITGAPSNGVLRVGPIADPPTSWINYPPTETQRANAGAVTTDGLGHIVVKLNQGAGSVDLTIDVNGYYGEPGNSSDLFVGPFTGNSFMTGDSNTGIGNDVLPNNTTGTANTAVGFLAMTFNSTGNNNTAVGSQALDLNVSGSGNVAVGRASMMFNQDGALNTAIGESSLQQNRSGTQNTSCGNGSMLFYTTGSRNSAFGIEALSGDATSGDDNTGVGFDALFSTTGSGNTALGHQAGFNLTSGDNNIDIGNQGVAGEAATIRIGDASQTATFISGIAATGVTGVPVLVDGSGQLGVASSSRAVKTDIRAIAEESDGLMKLRPVAFRYKPEIDPAELVTLRESGMTCEEIATHFGMTKSTVSRHLSENRGHPRRHLMKAGVP